MNRDVVVPYKFLGCSIDDCELFNYPRGTEGFLTLCSEHKMGVNVPFITSKYI